MRCNVLGACRVKLSHVTLQDKEAAAAAAQALEVELQAAAKSGAQITASLQAQCAALRGELAAAQQAAGEAGERERGADERARRAGAELASQREEAAARIAQLEADAQVGSCDAVNWHATASITWILVLAQNHVLDMHGLDMCHMFLHGKLIPVP